jgi:hypothetical protein
MKKEHSPSTPENPYQKFGFTESEILFNRITHKRFLEMLQDPKSKIHTIIESGNAYGEFLFVTVSRENNGQQLITTFYGLGFHEYRDRWFMDEWHWYQTYANSESCKGEISKDDAVKQVEARKNEILPYAEKATQSEAGHLFEILADLTDDDGAITEFDDLLGFLG